MEFRAHVRLGLLLAMVLLLVATMASGLKCRDEEMTPEEREDPLVKTLIPVFDKVAVYNLPSIVFLVREDDQSLLFNSLLAFATQGFRGQAVLLFTQGNPNDYTRAVVKLCNELSATKVYYISKLREADKYKRFPRLQPEFVDKDKGLILLDMLLEELATLDVGATDGESQPCNRMRLPLKRPTNLLIARLSDQYHPEMLKITRAHMDVAIGMKLHQESTLDLYDVIFKFDRIINQRIVIDELVEHPTGEGIDFENAGVRFVQKIYPNRHEIDPLKVIMKFTA